MIPSYFPGGANVHPHLIYGSLRPLEPAPKRHLDRFSRFRWPRGRYQHTGRQTGTPTTGNVKKWVGITRM